MPVVLTRYKSYALLICLLSPVLLPFIQLSIARIGFEFLYSNIANAIVLLIATTLMFIIIPVINKWQLIVIYYLVFKMMQSIQNNILFHNILITFVTIIFFYSMYGVVKKLNNKSLLRYIRIVSTFLLFILILSSEVNLIVKGVTLPLLFQNLSIVLLLISLLWCRFYYVGKPLNYWLYLLLAVIIYEGSLLIRAESLLAALQAKFIFMLLVIITIFMFVIIFKKRIYKRLYKRIKYKTLLFWVLIFTISAVLAYPYLISELSSLIYRTNSASVRNAVNQVMFSDTTNSLSTLFFGYGIGASISNFDISHIVERPSSIGPHSGLIIFFYEHGIIGVFLLVLTVVNSVKGLYKNASQFTLNDFGLKSPFFIILFVVISWVGFNLIIIFSIPGPDPFWNSGLSLFVMLWVVLIRDAECKHFK